MPSVGGRLPARLRALLNDQGVHNLRSPQIPWTAANVLEDLYFLMNRNVPASSIPAASAPTPAAAARALKGSPHALATLHQEAGRLLASGVSLTDALNALHGYPVVVNAWASWCPPCREELPLLRAAAARDGTRVAFLGLDVEDRTGAARRFLAAHPVGYPSYEDPGADAIRALAGFAGVPTTVFLGADGRVVAVHTGQYADAAALRRDIARYALAAR
jgi:thiol-disulfide isomerase/thioredoxin